ncbi:Chromosome partition protein Smc [Beijerinckiaceae bacterium RH AL1]|nr:Chromosome partition protein Smc [Beijerinckiaceae bacterium RH CH11]VVB44235.1 Chromosome partition protein Smc [Beijerinckiaceae bacterium RH AL8]VVC54224.1 Chromosome partition protein Smc [Beijerinckiaceae bacterium RH AL1]
MQLTKLRLVGFKSFVEAYDFDIQPGLTGVVGPNGCGKSNLVEALRWVMGESSYKSMRASGMDDVIFSGAGDRPARNVAEVGLTLDNSSRTAPAAFNDADVLEITRRIEREQGSTYRINGREVRARDVQILFADAATGARSPALVRQGQIAEIIAAKPQARRRILEDAAGVAGLHTRRHEAELRLKGAEDNLTRIDDVIAQIAAQGDGLRRQARHAHRYRELQADIRRAQALAVLIDHEEAEREVEEARRRLAEAGAAVIECTRLQGEAARHQAVAAHALPGLREAEGEASSALQKVVVARETLDGEERRAKSRFAEIERRIKEMEGDLERDAAVVEDAASMLARLGGEAEELDAVGGEATDESGLAARLAEAERARLEAEAALASAQTRLADAGAERRALAQRRADEAARLARLTRELADAEAALARLRASADPGDGLATAAATAQSAAAAMAAADTAAREAEQALARAREAEQAGRGPLAEADRAAQRLETEVRTLTKLLESAAGAKWPPIADALQVDKGFEAALGAALGDDLEASSDPRAPAHWAGGAAEAGDAPLPEGATPLASVVHGAPALARRLAQIGVVARAEGPALRAALKPGQRLVSREGDIWRWDGFTQAAEAPTPAARRLVERNRLADLRGEAARAAEALAKLKADGDAAQASLRAAVAHEAQARTAQRDARRAHETAREAHAALERRLAESAAKLAALDAAAASARAAHAEAAQRDAAAAAALAALAPSDAIAAEVEAARDAAARHRAIETETRATLQAIARERQARERRREAITQELASWEARRAQATAHRAEIDERLGEARQERDALAEAPDRFILARRQILAEVEAAEARLRAAADARARAEAALAEADRGARAALDAMAEAREANARAEARAEAADQRLEAVVRTAAAELECQPAALPAMAGVKAGEARPAAAFVAARLEQLKAERERLGAVNLRADEELASLEGQREGLDKEKADLTEAIRRLRQAISSLNKEGRERLLGAFDTVNGHFKDLFTSLFGGGTAELQLIESDDPLEAGLEILARPPGKKPQVMTLLSGGEQALTAMSLIFAVFLTNPSPICVLDEVDAPLDDSNVERFCDLVDEMRKKTDTRFIAITHNPITMARMDRLFGVTMAERGVSQLVSVALAEAEEMLEAS